MVTVITAIISFAVGGCLGALYGRAAEQSAVHRALNDLSLVDSSIAAFRTKLSARLTYLKKAL